MLVSSGNNFFIFSSGKIRSCAVPFIVTRSVPRLSKGIAATCKKATSQKKNGFMSTLEAHYQETLTQLCFFKIISGTVHATTSLWSSNRCFCSMAVIQVQLMLSHFLG